MWQLAWAVVAGSLLGLAAGCGDDDASDGGLFPAEADPNERTDCPSGPPEAGEVRAKHITCDSELAGGTVAMGRVGPDVVLENALAKFVVRGSDGAASFLGTGAGGLVDAAPQGGIDLIKDVMPLTGVSSAHATDVVVTSAGGEAASVRVLFEMDVVGLLAAVVPVAQPAAVHGAIDYELGPDERVLDVTVRLTPNEGQESVELAPGFGLLVGGGADLVQPEASGARMVLEGAESATALRMPLPGILSEIQSINLMEADDRITAVEGEAVDYAFRVGVGDTAAEAWSAATDDDPDLEPLTITGAAGDRAEILLADDTVAMRTRLDASGEAVVPLPPGDYRVRAGFDRFFPGALQDVTLGAGGASVDVGPAPSATLSVDVTTEVATDAATYEAAPVRVTVEHMAGGGELTRRVAVGPTDFRLPPGDYQVTVSRGMEFDLGAEDVMLEDGETALIEHELARVVDTSGWVAGDFHLHSEMSTDSRHWLGDALRIVAGEGLEVVAATDHDFITDYERHMAVAGVEGWVLTVPGSEVSHPIIAHVNGYPLVRDPSASANGSPPWFTTSPGEWFDAIRERGDTALDPAGALVQINHPRRSSSGLFESIELDRTTGMATRPPTELGLDPSADLNDFSVDSVEVWNKTPDDDDEESLLDYLALYSLGEPLAMMGNSDTHDSGRPAGSMRTYVKVGDGNDVRDGFTWEDVANGIRAREVTVAGGIFVTAEVTGVDAGEAQVSIDVQAPPWVDVERLRIYAGQNEDLALDEPITTPGEYDYPVELNGASFVVVRVDGGRGDPVLQHSTIGMTNPIDIP
ncbi:MAG: CehA/McbA family metallohydrolase [Myxococcota bacterium]